MACYLTSRNRFNINLINVYLRTHNKTHWHLLPRHLCKSGPNCTNILDADNTVCNTVPNVCRHIAGIITTTLLEKLPTSFWSMSEGICKSRIEVSHWCQLRRPGVQSVFQFIWCSEVKDTRVLPHLVWLTISHGALLWAQRHCCTRAIVPFSFYLVAPV